MVRGKIQLCFDKERKDGGDFYYSTAIKFLSFKFNEDTYYMGLLCGIEKYEKAFLHKKYIVEVEFLSMEDKNMLIGGKELPICVGTSIIGKGIVLEVY